MKIEHLVFNQCKKEMKKINFSISSIKKAIKDLI